MDGAVQQPPRAVQAARRAWEIEVDAVRAAWDRNEAALARAVEVLGGVRGRVVVCGLGKSGHVGAKIAASLASMGVPSLFLHAAEALHGDLGMVTGDDAGLLISNSGTTEEVLLVAQMMNRWGVPVVSMTRADDTPLAQLAAVNLDIEVEREADPLGLAPTSSSLVTLLLGDLLAVALQSDRDFCENDFAERHPGGALGAKLLGGERP